MNRMIYEHYDYCGGKMRESLVGAMETVKWKSTSWCGGPKEPGTYIVSDGRRNIRDLLCTGGNKTGMSLFQSYIEDRFENVYFSNGKSLTSDDLIELCRQYYVWYEINTVYTDCGEMEDLIIMTDEDKPKYFIETNLQGPIDSEFDTYDKTYVDLDCNVIPEEERKVSR